MRSSDHGRGLAGLSSGVQLQSDGRVQVAVEATDSSVGPAVSNGVAVAQAVAWIDRSLAAIEQIEQAVGEVAREFMHAQRGAFRDPATGSERVARLCAAAESRVSALEASAVLLLDPKSGDLEGAYPVLSDELVKVGHTQSSLRQLLLNAATSSDPVALRRGIETELLNLAAARQVIRAVREQLTAALRRWEVAIANRSAVR